jgi:hypothetical protein
LSPAGTFSQLNAGNYHTCAIKKSDNTLVCWGNNDDDQLIAPGGNFKQISAGGSHNCAIKSDDTVACWGTNDDNESSPPTDTFTQISAGSVHTCGIKKSDGTITCWGDNSEGQASPPAGLFTQISAGDVHTCGIRSDGTVSCWGNNDDGQAPLLMLNPAILPFASVGVAYSQPITTSAENYTPTLPILTLSSGVLPNGISLTGAPGGLSGTPTLGGIYAFTLRVIDANGLNAEQAYTLKVNTAPVANSQNITTAQDTQSSIILSASDADTDVLAYVFSNPLHGTLSGTAPNLIYTPSTGYTGADSFTFKANDGQADSNTATVSITVGPTQSNTPPVADSQNITMNRNTAKGITLTASDANGNPLSYTVISNPAHGTLNGIAPHLTYTPTANFTGNDSFTFKANDGHADSNTATINITISAANLAPVADSQNVTTLRNTALSIKLTGSDGDSDPLTYAVVGQPISGTLSGAAPNLTYTPNADFIGLDSFTFKVNDGQLDSSIATIHVTVKPNVPYNQPPVANNQTASTARNTAKSIMLTASDNEGDLLTYTIIDHPTHGALSGNAPNFTYTPQTGFTGSDSFTFKVNDGQADSNIATITIMVTSINAPPVANDQNVTMPQDIVGRSIRLTASDSNGDALTYVVISNPAHGTLSGTAPDLAYKPNAGYTGPDSFTFKANDGQADSNTATVTINVTPGSTVNMPPIANDQNVSTAQETPKNITLTASDADGNPLTYIVVSNPAHGVLSGAAPNLTYTPSAGFNGVDSFTFKANDGQLDSNTATVTINVATSGSQGSIKGIIYNDKNSNGQKDSDEPGIANITVILSDATADMQAAASDGSNTERRTLTDGDGVYRFSSVPAGHYNLTVVFPFGFEVAGQSQVSITVGSAGEVTPAPFALKGSYSVLLPLIRR